MTKAEVITDSISESGHRITTMVIEFPRFILPEFATHRMFSKNAASSRAIPVEKMIQRVEEEPFIPTYWGKNQKGMQAFEELDGEVIYKAEGYWKKVLAFTVFMVKLLVKLGVHKQLANRLLEPFSYTQLIITATEWDNFFEQRISKYAQPEIKELAEKIKEARDNSTPKLLEVGEWHLPFITDVDESTLFGMPQGGEGNLAWLGNTLKNLSVARCARVSYGLNSRDNKTIEDDLKLYDMLLSQKHLSPFEHIARPMVKHDPWQNELKGVTHLDTMGWVWSANFKGWVQYRKLIEN